VFAEYNLNAQLLIIILEVLDIKSADTLQTVVQQAHEIPLASPSDIGVRGPSARVVLGDEVPVVSPVFFELLEESVRLLLGEIKLLQDGVTLEIMLEIYS